MLKAFFEDPNYALKSLRKTLTFFLKNVSGMPKICFEFPNDFLKKNVSEILQGGGFILRILQFLFLAEDALDLFILLRFSCQKDITKVEK